MLAGAPLLLLLGVRFQARNTKMGWSQPDTWRWGSPIGEAHDQALALRNKLNDQDQRSDFLFKVFAGAAELEQVKLALALKCQRARNMNYDTERKWEALMDDMALAKFEGPEGKEKLCDAIRERLGNDAPAEPAGIDAFNILAATALKTLHFVERGL